MKSTPVFNELQKHWSLMQAKAKLEARVELVNQLKETKRPVKQVQDLIKEYEKMAKMNEQWLQENYPQPQEDTNE